MFAHILTLSVFFVTLRLLKGESTKNPVNDESLKVTMKSSSNYVATTDSWDANPNLNSLWIYRPSLLRLRNEPEVTDHRVLWRVPFALTRLAKPLSLGFDPYFNKGYFEPFERRQRPVTLIAFRRNGWLPKQTVKIDDTKSPEVAEIQSPFNEIGNFWQDEARLINE